MTTEQRRNVLGLTEKKRIITDPQAHFRRQAAEAVRRGTEEIALTNSALAHDPASSANRRAASAAAQRKNQRAIDLLREGKCPAFNPIAQKA